MKKLMILSIFLFILFARDTSHAGCYYNYPYNWQYVTYCYWNDENQYNYWNYYNEYYNYWYWNVWQYSYDYYYRNSSYAPFRSSEENYYNLKYLNNIWWPWEEKKEDDFFTKNVIWNNVELDKINAIKLNSYTFRYSSNTAKYNEAKRFVEELKNEAKNRYIQKKISREKIYDIINDLDYLVYNLNKQFDYTLQYDRTWNVDYKNIANEYATIVKTNYDKLKFTIKN